MSDYRNDHESNSGTYLTSSPGCHISKKQNPIGKRIPEVSGSRKQEPTTNTSKKGKEFPPVKLSPILNLRVLVYQYAI